VGAHELTGVETPVDLGVRGRRDPLAQRPLRTVVVLRLDREQVPDDGRRIVEPLADEALRRQSPDGDVVRAQLTRARRGP
jgi:hypothetical protein